MPDSILNDVKGWRYSAIFESIFHRIGKQKKIHSTVYVYDSWWIPTILTVCLIYFCEYNEQSYPISLSTGASIISHLYLVIYQRGQLEKQVTLFTVLLINISHIDKTTILRSHLYCHINQSVAQLSCVDMCNDDFGPANYQVTYKQTKSVYFIF